MKAKNQGDQDTQNSFKKFWQKFKENWLWVNIGGIIANTFFLWILYYFEIISLGYAIAATLFYPFLIILLVLIRKSKNPQLIYKIVAIGIGGFVIADVLWLLLVSILIWQPWSPLSGYFSPKERIWFYIVFFILIWSIIMVSIYLIGKKKGWKYQPKY